MIENVNNKLGFFIQNGVDLVGQPIYHFIEVPTAESAVQNAPEPKTVYIKPKYFSTNTNLYKR